MYCMSGQVSIFVRQNRNVVGHFIGIIKIIMIIYSVLFGEKICPHIMSNQSYM